MTEEKLKELLDSLRSLPSETEWLEFKEAKANFDFNKLGKYFSALSNEANLKSKPCGWLILGIEDKNRRIVHTRYLSSSTSLEKMKSEITEKKWASQFHEKVCCAPGKMLTIAIRCPIIFLEVIW